MTSITFPNSLTNIGTLAFYSCSALTSITIPNSVTSIARRAFEGCNGLTSIVVEEGNTKYDSRDNCNAIIETLSNTLICGFKNTTIPNSVTCIGSEAFYGCSDLTSITIPNSVKNIDYYAFEGCSGLTDIYCYAEIVPKADSDFFGKTSINTIILHVPAASIKAYKTTTPWSRFKEIVALN